MHLGVCGTTRPLYSSVLSFLKTCASPWFYSSHLKKKKWHAPFPPFVFLLPLGIDCLLFTVIWPNTDPGYDSCPAAQFLEPGPARTHQVIWALSDRDRDHLLAINGQQLDARTQSWMHLPVLEVAEDGVCRWEEEYADESKLRGVDGDGGNMQE